MVTCKCTNDKLRISYPAACILNQVSIQIYFGYSLLESLDEVYHVYEDSKRAFVPIAITNKERPVVSVHHCEGTYI